MISSNELASLAGRELHGSDGKKIGTIDTLYADREDGQPTFATVHTGLFGSHTTFVPVQEATVQGNHVVVPYDQALVKDAPRIEADQELSPEEEERLYTHYRVGQTTAAPIASTGTAGQDVSSVGTGREEVRGTVGHDTSGPSTDDAMTRSEERLQVGTQQAEVGRARLRKYIVTENATTTVPVSREQVRVEREPITESNAGQALDGPDLSEDEHEVVLHAEKPVVAKETVPVERVRLGTETVTEEQTVSEQVRKEQIETDGDLPNSR